METLQRAVAIAAHVGILARRVTELAGGNQNHVVRVQGGSHDVVVRFAKDESRMLIDPFDIEAWCLREAARVGIQTSPLLARGVLDGISYLVIGHVPGTDADSADRKAWWEIGRTALALKGVDVATAPDALFSRFGRDLDAAWCAHVEYNLAELSTDDVLCELGVYRPTDRAALREALSQLQRRTLQQGLVHGDMSSRNVVVSNQYAVIDWGSAHAGPACWGDLDQINRWRLLGDPDVQVSSTAWLAVLDGANLTEAEAAPVLVELAVLHALDVVRWALDRRPDRLPELAEQSTRLLTALGMTA